MADGMDVVGPQPFDDECTCAECVYRRRRGMETLGIVGGKQAPLSTDPGACPPNFNYKHASDCYWPEQHCICFHRNTPTGELVRKWDDEFVKFVTEMKPGGITMTKDPLSVQPPPLRSYNSEERKAVPIHAFMTGYFPDALWVLARLSKKANDKHNPGEVMHWARGKSTDQLECATRHLFTPFEPDPETGEIELAAVAWRALAELQLHEEKRLIAAGIKPLSGHTDVK